MSEGWLANAVSAIKGLTLTNAAVVLLLAAALIPAYFVYRVLTDQALLDRFLSHYKETASPGTNCTLREARMRGGPETWAISTGLLFQGSDRWTVTVLLDHPPADEAEVASYCDTLNIIVDHLHGGGTDTP